MNQSFKILAFDFWSVLSPAQQGAGSKRVKFLLETQKNVRLLLKYLGKGLSYNITRS